MQKKAFSFVEIIIVISILALLGVIGLKFYSDADNDANNSKAISDITTVNNSIQSYFEQEKILPNPKGNISYFGSGSEYVHVDNGDKNDSTKSFGKHGFVTQDLLPKKYLNYLPIDPRTNQFYAYGKTTDDNFYEIAGVVKINGKYKSKVVGNYPGEYGPYSLIREYNGQDFVGNNSSQSFPYNPDEKIIVAKINSFSGTVTISSDNYSISSSTTPDQILEQTLVEGDTIEVTSGGQADIYYSDGSQSSLGDSSQDSSLTITKMIFYGEENLVTKISLALESGTLWTKAPELNSDGSDFEVYTTDTSASVRGTIFAVKVTPSNETIVTVEKGTVEVKKIEKKSDNTSINNINELIESIQSEDIKKDNINISGITTTENGNSVIKVIGTNSPKTGNITNTSSSSNILPLELENFSSNLNFKIEELDINLASGENISNFIIPIKQFPKKINSIAFINNDGIYLSKVDNSLEKLTLDSNTEFFNTNTDFTQTKKEVNSLYLKNIELSTSTTLSDIIKDKNKLEIYLCKYSNKYLKCGGKRSIQIKGNKIKSKDEEEEKNIYEEIENRNRENDDIAFREEPTDQPCTTGSEKNGYILSSDLSHNGEIELTKNSGNMFSYGDTNNVTGNKTKTGKVKCDNGELSLIANSEIESISCNNINYSKFEADLNGDGTKEVYCEEKVDGKELYAFAPYDIAGNLDLYSNNTINKTSYGINNSTENCSSTDNSRPNNIDLGLERIDANNGSFCKDSNNIKGVVIEDFDNDHNDFLEYSNLGLNNDFVIEMSISKKALENSGRKFIFDNNNGEGLAYYKHNSGINVLFYNNSQICNDSNSTPKKCELYFTNDFEKIIYNNQNKTVLFGGQSFNITEINLDNIFIGSKNDKTSQLNGIINYIKIYN